MKKYGGIELGGTKMVCAICDDDGNIIDRLVIPTQERDNTLSQLLDYFVGKDISSLGIGSFGPVDLDKTSNTFGFITTTPKPGWNNTDVLGAFKSLGVPIGFDTDVNAACLGEVIYGAGKGLDNVVYITVGTGIGFGLFINGKLLHGIMHPEAGHMMINRHTFDMDFEGPCPYHDNCLETLASGPSIEKRWNKKATELYDNNIVWQLEAYYLGQALANCIMCYSPEKIIIGGGIIHVPGLIEMIRKETLKSLNGYIKVDRILNCINEYIVKPELKDDCGVIGAAELGRLELNG